MSFDKYGDLPFCACARCARGRPIRIGRSGEWRIASSNQDCPNLDHEIKFNVCQACKVHRYCAAPCQEKDWEKHKAYNRAGRV